MDDRVGFKIPSEKEIRSMIEQVQKIRQQTEDWTVLLTPQERLEVTKFRPGGEHIVQVVGELATHHAVSLPGISPEGMRADLLLAQRVAPLAQAVTALAQRLDDTLLEAHGESWWAATAFYTALARLAGSNAALQQGLAEVVAFFAVGRRKKAEVSAPAGTPSAK